MPPKKKTRGKARRRVAKSRTAREDNAAAKNDDVDSKMQRLRQRLQIGKSANEQDGDDDVDALLEEAIKLAAAEREELDIAAEKEEKLENAAEKKELENAAVKEKLQTAAKTYEVCEHGHIPFPRGHFCIAFISKCWDVHVDCADSDLFTRLERVHETTKVKWAKVWNDSDMMHWVVSDFVRAGTQGIIEFEYGMVRHVAAFVNFLEQWMAITIEEYEIEASAKWDFFQTMCDCHKIAEMFVADDHTLVSFFKKRIPCQCLDKRYEDVKSITKMGICHNFNCSLPDRKVTRSKMLYCTQCKKANYCSRECQVDDWQSHKTICNAYASVSAARKSGQKIMAEVGEPSISMYQNASM